VAEADFRLECDAFMVRDSGGGLLEEENHISRLYSGSYQKVLDKVAARLRGKTE
jgi:hypothetical protein